MPPKHIVYLDSSALIKIFVEEDGPLEIKQYMKETVAVGNVCFMTT